MSFPKYDPDDYTELERVLVGRVQPQLDEIKIGELLDATSEEQEKPVEIATGVVVEIDCRCHDGYLIVKDPEPNENGIIRCWLPKWDQTPDGGLNFSDSWPIQAEDVIPRPDLTDVVHKILSAKITLADSGHFDATVDTLDQALYEILGVEAR